jgi:hypothetical protein
MTSAQLKLVNKLVEQADVAHLISSLQSSACMQVLKLMKQPLTDVNGPASMLQAIPTHMAHAEQAFR